MLLWHRFQALNCLMLSIGCIRSIVRFSGSRPNSPAAFSISSVDSGVRPLSRLFAVLISYPQAAARSSAVLSRLASSALRFLLAVSVRLTNTTPSSTGYAGEAESHWSCWLSCLVSFRWFIRYANS
nr:MAG TPA: hypothetical protein [Caudoviricetes sp.]